MTSTVWKKIFYISNYNFSKRYIQFWGKFKYIRISKFKMANPKQQTEVKGKVEIGIRIQLFFQILIRHFKFWNFNIISDLAIPKTSIEYQSFIRIAKSVFMWFLYIGFRCAYMLHYKLRAHLFSVHICYTHYDGVKRST